MARATRTEIIARYLDMIGVSHVPARPVRVLNRGSAKQEIASLTGRKRELNELREHIGICTRCRLCEGRKNVVFGVGNPDTDIMFIGEGPGVDEDIQGEPFVGAAGKRLNLWIARLGYERKDVYIANIVKCRPPGNRTPRPDEAATCLPFLKRQIDIIAPKLIVTLGGPALNYLLGRNERITRVRGTRFLYADIPLFPTYHPAYILRNPAREKEVFLDLDTIKDLLKKK